MKSSKQSYSEKSNAYFCDQQSLWLPLPQHRNWSTWKIMPRYRKVRGEGHKVCNKDEIMLELNRGDDFLHVSGARNDDDVHEVCPPPLCPFASAPGPV